MALSINIFCELKTGDIKLNNKLKKLVIITSLITIILVIDNLDGKNLIKNAEYSSSITSKISGYIKSRPEFFSDMGNPFIMTGIKEIRLNDYRIQFSLDCFEKVADVLLQMHANIFFGYSIWVDKKGKPEDIDVIWMNESNRNLLEGILNAEDVLFCIKLNWRFRGFNNSPINILIRYQSDKGFTSIFIFNEHFNYFMNITADNKAISEK
jgi:hypothetical protein